MSLQKIANLLTSRDRLIEARKMLAAPINDLKHVGLRLEFKNTEKACKKTLKAIEKDIEGIEKDIEGIIAQNKEIGDNYRSVSSVPNVGKITTLHLLLATNNFKRFDNSKQLGSYRGVAPFEYRSGTSVRGKTKVNHMSK